MIVSGSHIKNSIDGDIAKSVAEALGVDAAFADGNRIEILQDENSEKVSIIAHERNRFFTLEVSPQEICRTVVYWHGESSEITTFNNETNQIQKQTRPWNCRASFNGMLRNVDIADPEKEKNDLTTLVGQVIKTLGAMSGAEFDQNKEQVLAKLRAGLSRDVGEDFENGPEYAALRRYYYDSREPRLNRPAPR